MRTTMEIRYELCREDEHGFDPLAESFSTLSEAQSALRNFPGAFVVRTTMVRIRTDRTIRLRAV